VPLRGAKNHIDFIMQTPIWTKPADALIGAGLACCGVTLGKAISVARALVEATKPPTV